MSGERREALRTKWWMKSSLKYPALVHELSSRRVERGGGGRGQSNWRASGRGSRGQKAVRLVPELLRANTGEWHLTLLGE